jgi:hypothetical protein
MPLEFTLTARDTQSAILDPRAQSGLIDILTEAGMLKSKFAMRAEASDEIREWLEENFRNGDFYQQMHDAGFVKETAPVVERRRSIG